MLNVYHNFHLFSLLKATGMPYRCLNNATPYANDLLSVVSIESCFNH